MRRLKWPLYIGITVIVLGIFGASVWGTGAMPAGTPFPFQGYLTMGGSPVNQSCDIKVALFGAPSGGTALETYSAPGTSVADGMFTVMLQYSPEHLNGDPRWLETSVACAGAASYTTLEPRQALSSVPHAAQAGSAGAIKGRPVSSVQPEQGQLLQWTGTEWAPVTPAAGGGVASVTASAPLSSTGGANPIISLPMASPTAAGAMSPGDKAKLDNIYPVTAGAGLMMSGSTMSLKNCGGAGYILRSSFQGWDCVSGGGVKVAQSGPAPATPLSAQIATRGGAVSIQLSGTVMGTAPGPIGLVVKINGQERGRAKLVIEADEVNRHRALPALNLVENLVAGNHTIQVELMPGTTWNADDTYSLAVVEYPFGYLSN